MSFTFWILGALFIMNIIILATIYAVARKKFPFALIGFLTLWIVLLAGILLGITHGTSKISLEECRQHPENITLAYDFDDNIYYYNLNNECALKSSILSFIKPNIVETHMQLWITTEDGNLQVKNKE